MNTRAALLELQLFQAAKLGVASSGDSCLVNGVLQASEMFRLARRHFFPMRMQSEQFDIHPRATKLFAAASKSCAK